MDQTPLSELLGNTDDAEQIEAQPVDDGPLQDDQQASTETGVEPEQGEPEPEAVPPTAGLPKEEYKALRDEREKRQKLEAELETLRQHFASQQQPPVEPPSIWDDDQGALQHVKNEAVTLAVQQATMNAKLDMSEMMVRQANPDFEETKAEFLALAEQNPGLVQQALADPHPWNKAYQIAKNHRAMTELGATDVASLEARLREKIMAEMQGQVPVSRALPPTITGERSVASRSGPAWAGPTPLADLLKP